MKNSEPLFVIGGIEFAAVRVRAPRTHWCFKLIETGVVHQSGTGGISNVSVPKMKESLVYLLERVSKGDEADFRDRFGLPSTKGSC